MKSVFFFFLIACTAFAQTASPPLPAHVETDYVNDAIFLRVGGMNIAPHQTGHFQAEATIEKEGWITTYLGDMMWAPAFPPTNLHFTVSNTSRTDLLCKDRDETIASYAIGGPSWPDMREYGYHLRQGDRLKINVELKNDDEQPIKDGRVIIDLKFQRINEPPFRRDAYPMWFNTRGCGPVDFDLKPGKNISSGTFEIPVTGTLVALQGGLREDAEYLEVANRSRELTFLHQQWNGPEHPLPLVTPKAGTEFRVDQGDFIAVAAGYNNPSNKEAKDAGMGAALGLFVPVDEAKMAAFEKKKDAATAKATAADPNP